MRVCPFDIDKAASLARIITITSANTPRVLRFTDAQNDVTLTDTSGTFTWKSEPGCISSAMSYFSDGTVANSEILLAFDASSQLKPTDAVYGFYDGAQCLIQLVDPTNPAGGTMTLLSGYIGNVKQTREGLVSLEARSVLMRARSIVTERFGPMCRADFGDDRCKVAVLPADIQRSTSYTQTNGVRDYDTVNGSWVRVRITSFDQPVDYQNFVWECTTTGVTDSSPVAYSGPVGTVITDGTAQFTCRDSWVRAAELTGTVIDGHTVTLDALPDPRASVDGFYTLGTLIIRSGTNNGLSLPISNWIAGTLTVGFFLDISEIFPDGDDPSVEIMKGCDKTESACFNVFGNIVNRRAETFCPGRDLALTIVGGGAPAGNFGKSGVGTFV